MIFCFIFKFLKIKEKFKNELLESMTLFGGGIGLFTAKNQNLGKCTEIASHILLLIYSRIKLKSQEIQI